jgi:hypothetical protein
MTGMEQPIINFKRSVWMRRADLIAGKKSITCNWKGITVIQDKSTKSAEAGLIVLPPPRLISPNQEDSQWLN